MSIVVATTAAPFAVLTDTRVGTSWLDTGEELIVDSLVNGHELRYFAALEYDARGTGIFAPIRERFDALEKAGAAAATEWYYTLEDGRTEVTTKNRLRHLTMGQNLASEYATAIGAEWLLFMAADCTPDPQTFSKLLPHNRKYIGGHVSTYCLDGPAVPYASGDLRYHMPTAAYVLLHRDVFKVLRWRSDPDEGLTDDHALYRDALQLLGIEAVVDHGCIGRHYPESIPAIEDRGYDLNIHRGEGN